MVDGNPFWNGRIAAKASEHPSSIHHQITPKFLRILGENGREKVEERFVADGSWWLNGKNGGNHWGWCTGAWRREGWASFYFFLFSFPFFSDWAVPISLPATATHVEPHNFMEKSKLWLNDHFTPNFACLLLLHYNSVSRTVCAYASVSTNTTRIRQENRSYTTQQGSQTFASKGIFVNSLIKIIKTVKLGKGRYN